ncbi:SAC3 family protein A-like isoform X1 [Tripterygium wilfordii]|nr:SAC3 family protein A-like isoform X1 [Tripterygium wilfordii]
MMNQGSNTQTVAPAGPNSLETRHVTDASQGETASYFPSTTRSEAVLWTLPRADNPSVENGTPSSDYPYEQQPMRIIQDGSNATSAASSSSLGTTNASQAYNGYASYPNSSDPYGYGNAGYPGYYSGYHQHQQTNHSYAQPAEAYQNTGAPHQPISSFKNTGSYAGPASYSGTYYNPGTYQTAGAYPSGGYSNQTTVWNEGNYANYAPHQYSNYISDTTGTYSSGTVAATTQQYQQHYQQWADYSSQTEVICAPGTENLSVASTSNQGLSAPSTSIVYPTSNSQPPPSSNPSWRPDSGLSELPSLQPNAAASGAHDSYWKQRVPSFQNHHASPVQTHFQKPLDSQNSYNNFQDQQKSAYPQVPNSQNPAPHQVLQSFQSPHRVPQTYQPPHLVPQTYQPPHLVPQTYQPSHLVPQTYQSPQPQNCQSPQQSVPSLDLRRGTKVQIPTNPRIASNLALGLPKSDKDSYTASATVKPAYISVSLPKPNDSVSSNDAVNGVIKPDSFPKSLRGYVERALARCKDDAQLAACQAAMKEIITKATADGTLHTRDWDTEPLFPLPSPNIANKDNLHYAAPVSSLPKFKRSPSRRSKSRWEPLPEEKSIDKPVSVSNDTVKYGGWDRKPLSVNSNSKEDGLTSAKFSLNNKKFSSKNAQRRVKKQRLADACNAADNGDASSDSDKKQTLTAYYSGAIALANSPDERKRRENRFKRFEKGQGNQAEINYSKAKKVGNENLYNRRASALVLSQNFDDGASKAVEDIDWDALTVKGTCQDIEKRYLRLTSAPDPTTVRPGEVLQKALLMVQNSHKNYLYKCDQLKSIRQDLTVQRIHNQLTVKVYETHARLALEVGDLPEYNQCQSQLMTLYAEGIAGCHMEFAAYNLLCVILHSNNNRDVLSSMSRLSDKAKQDEAVKHALAVRRAVTSGNYVMFFKLYKSAPNLNACHMDLYVEKMRYKAVSCMSRSYRPTVPVSYIANVLGFTRVLPINEVSREVSDGLEECLEWLKAHGACLTTDNIGELQLDTKTSSSSLYMPEPDDAVAHGDASLAVNDFLARTSL